MGAALTAKVNVKKQELLDKLKRLREKDELYQAELREELRKENERRQALSVRYEKAKREIQDYLETIKDVPGNDFRYAPVREGGAFFLESIQSLYEAKEVDLHDLIKAMECIVDLARSVELVRKCQAMRIDEEEKIETLHFLTKRVERSHQKVEERADKLEGSSRNTHRILGRLARGFGLALMVLGALTIVSAVFLTLVCPVTAVLWGGLAGFVAGTIGYSLWSDGKEVTKANERVGLPHYLCLFGDAFKDSVSPDDFPELSLREEIHRDLR